MRFWQLCWAEYEGIFPTLRRLGQVTLTGKEPIMQCRLIVYILQGCDLKIDHGDNFVTRRQKKFFVVLLVVLLVLSSMVGLLLLYI
jgi:cytochrome c-type biogenesis protein CcmE